MCVMCVDMHFNHVEHVWQARTHASKAKKKIMLQRVGAGAKEEKESERKEGMKETQQIINAIIK